MLRADDHYPPLAPLAASPAFGWRGGDPRVPTLFLNQAALALLLAATYALGKRHFSGTTGLLAAIALTSFPLVSTQSRMFMLDLPDAAATALGLVALSRCDRFRRLGPALVFGVVLGLGLLTKWTIVFYLAVPLAFELAAGLREEDRVRRLGRSAAALLLAAALAAPWYAVHLWNLARDATKFSYDVGVREGDPPVASARSLLFYPAALPRAVLFPWALLFLASVVVEARGGFRRGRILLLSLASGGIALTLIRNKDARYLMPLLPLVAVLGASLFERVRIRTAAKVLAVALFGLASLAIAWKREPPVAERWPVREAVDFLRRQPGARPRVRVIPDWPYFERHAFEYYAKAARSPIDVGSWFNFPNFTDFVVVKSGDQGERQEPGALMREIEDPGGDFPRLFRPVWERPLPDGTVTRIFERDVKPVTSSADEVLARFRAAAGDLAARYFRDPDGLELDIETFSPEETRKGRLRRVGLRIRSASLSGRRSGSPALAVRNVRLEAAGLEINPYRLLREGKIEVLALGAAAPSIEVGESDASGYLSAVLRRPASVRFRGGSISIEATPARRFFAASIDVRPEIRGGDNLAVVFERIRLGRLPIPAVFAQALAAGNNPVLKPMPCRLRLGELRSEGGVLKLDSAGYQTRIRTASPTSARDFR